MSDAATVRAFVALEMPERIREVIRREQGHLKASLPRARWTRPEGQHLTLKFLGETTVEKLARLKKEVSDRAAACPRSRFASMAPVSSRPHEGRGSPGSVERLRAAPRSPLRWRRLRPPPVFPARAESGRFT